MPGNLGTPVENMVALTRSLKNFVLELDFSYPPSFSCRQVRDIRTNEADGYGGESTGIRANVTRGRHLKG